jgi:hypothetical protein
MEKMQYNECDYCGAKDGRAGLLISSPQLNIIKACQNCYDTLKNGEITIHTRLNRTQEELEKTMKLLTKKDDK